MHGQRLEHRRYQRRRNLVELHPLHEQPLLIEVMLDATVELVSEKARDAAYPRIGGFGNDDVVALLVRREKGFRVLDVDTATGVSINVVITRAEATGGL